MVQLKNRAQPLEERLLSFYRNYYREVLTRKWLRLFLYASLAEVPQPLDLVVISIGGIGSIRGALVGSLLVGLLDTAGRAFLPFLFRQMFPSVIAAEAGPAVASVLIYVLMAAVLYFRPSGLFPARG